MYLNTVLSTLEKKKCGAEDLYQLNEAIFNLPEDDTIDKKTSARLFQAAVKINSAFSQGRYDQQDPNFFYDYLALLGTLQNQHFFSAKQNETMLKWLHDALSEKLGLGGPPAPAAKPPARGSEDVAKLQAENEALRKHVAQLQELASAIQVVQTFKLPEKAAVAGGAKGKGKSSGRRRGKGKGKGKGGEEETS